MAWEHRHPRGKESARPGLGLTRAERVNPARVRRGVPGMHAGGGRPTVMGAELLWQDRVPKKRTPAAERRQETAGRSTGGLLPGGRRITGRIPGPGVPGPERGADVGR
jgi:hypothetical protein